jgi:hypothetical protein
VYILHLRNNDNERGAISSDRKYNKLSGAGLSKIIMEVPSPLLLLALAIELKSSSRGTCIPSSHSRTGIMSCHVEKDFRVLGIYSKTYNKWFPCQKGRQPWHQTQAAGKYRIYARMIEFDHSLGLGANWAYQDTDPANSNWGVKRASMFCVMLLTSQRCWGRLRFRLDLDN